MSDLMKSRETEEPRSCCFIEKAPAVHDIVKVKNQQTGQNGRELVSTLVIFHRGDAHTSLERFVERWPDRALRSVVARLNSFHQGRRNLRSLAYMKESLNGRLGSPGLSQGNDLSILSHVNWREFDQIILLWPDGNGMGWYDIERQVFGDKKGSTPVYVLNGRKRLFELPRTLWRGYRFRRFLEKSFLLEIGVVVLFFVTAPALALWDMASEPEGRHK